MRIELAFGHYQHFPVEPQRISRLLDPDSTVATAMGIKDTLTDYFRTEKKSVALALLHELLSDAQIINERLECVTFPYALTAFSMLTSLAEAGYQDQFHTEYNTVERVIIFSVGNVVVKKLDFSDALDGIYINGKHFLNHYDDILDAYDKLHDRLLKGIPEKTHCGASNSDKQHASCFYLAHPKLKDLLLQCHVQYYDNINAIIDSLISCGRIKPHKQGRVYAEKITRDLCK